MLKTEPVLVLLNGLGAVVSVVLAALVIVDVINWDAAQIGGVVAAVTAVCGLLSLVIRAAVVSPATNSADISDALDFPNAPDLAPVVNVNVTGSVADSAELAEQIRRGLHGRGGQISG